MMEAAPKAAARPKVGDYAKLQPLIPVCMHRRIPSAFLPALVHQPRRRPSSGDPSATPDHDQQHNHQFECTLCRRHWPDRPTFLAHLRDHRAPIVAPNMAVEVGLNLQLSLHPGATAKTYELCLRNQTDQPIDIRHLFILSDRCSWIFDFDDFESDADDDDDDDEVIVPAGQHVTIELAAFYVRPHRTSTVLVQTVRSGSEFTEWHRLPGCCSTAQRCMVKRKVPTQPCDPALLALLQGSASAARRRMDVLRSQYQPLAAGNYCEFFELANQIERIDKQLEVSCYATTAPQQFSIPAKGGPGQFFLKVPDELMPNGEPCKLTLYDTVRFTPCDGRPVAGGSDKRFCVAEICNVTARGLLTVRLLGPRTDTKRTYNVSFHIGTYVYDIEVAALRWLTECRVLPLLFPLAADVAAPSVASPVDHAAFQWFAADLNERQQMAVRHIVHGTASPAPYLLFGPPGTGKTKTLCEAVLQLWRCKPDSRLLVCASSNAAADELALRLMPHLPHSCRFEHNMFRLYARACAKRPPTEGMLRLAALSNAPEFDCPAWSFLRRFRIVVCTLVVAGGLRFGVGVEAADFTHVIVDESGSSTELATLLPIALCTTADRIHAHLVLAGDPKQLGPVIKSGHAVRLGYGVSLLERLMRLPVYSSRPHRNGGAYNRNVLTKLVNNYRSHPLLVSLSNQAFYGGELRACAPPARANRFVDWPRLPVAGVPIIFHAVTGVAQRDLGSPSLHNPVELKIVVGYVEQLLLGDAAHPAVRPPVAQTDIGIISPYAVQCQKIRQALVDRGWPDILVAPVETFQGRERPVILTSTVRSLRTVAGLGFLGSAKRLNVMLTRAQALLIMVGDPQTLMLDRHWRRVLRRFQELRVCVGEEFRMPHEQQWPHQPAPGTWYRPNYQRRFQQLQQQQAIGAVENSGSAASSAAIKQTFATVEDIDATPEELAVAAGAESSYDDDDDDDEDAEQYLRLGNWEQTMQEPTMRIKIQARAIGSTQVKVCETSATSCLSLADSAFSSMPPSRNTSAATAQLDDDDDDDCSTGGHVSDDHDCVNNSNTPSKCTVCKKPYWRPTNPTSPTEFFSGDLSIVFPRADNDPDGQPLVVHCPKIRHSIDLLSSELYREPKEAELPQSAAATAAATTTGSSESLQEDQWQELYNKINKLKLEESSE